MFKVRLKFYFITLFLLSLNAQASKDSKDIDLGQIYINSDNLTYNRAGNFASFDGNVILWFNDMVLKTTNIKIYYKQVKGGNKIDRIVIPEKLSAFKCKDSDILIAENAVYAFDKNELSLEGNVILQHKDDILKTNKLVVITELKKIDNH